jgi:hypothetical protein
MLLGEYTFRRMRNRHIVITIIFFAIPLLSKIFWRFSSCPFSLMPGFSKESSLFQNDRRQSTKISLNVLWQATGADKFGCIVIFVAYNILTARTALTGRSRTSTSFDFGSNQTPAESYPRSRAPSK